MKNYCFFPNSHSIFVVVVMGYIMITLYSLPLVDVDFPVKFNAED